jgi:hypothetical protein
MMGLGRDSGGLRAVLCALCLLVTVSCTTRSARRVERLHDATSTSDYLGAIERIREKPELYGQLNQLLYHLDIGLLFHYAEQFDSSNTYLLKAADIREELYTRSVTNEAVSILTNSNVRPYRSYPYEIVFLHQVLALNFMALGQTDEALVEARRTQLLFNEWERKNAKHNRYFTDGMFHYLTSVAYDEAGESDDAMISLFHAVKAFQAGPVPLPDPIRDYAHHMFVLNGRESDNELLELEPAGPPEDVPGLDNGLSEIVVVGYAGRGPVLRERVWWGTYVRDGLLILHHRSPDGSDETITLPAPGLPEEEYQRASEGRTTKSGTTFHIKVATPVVTPTPSVTEYFTLDSGHTPVSLRSWEVNDLDLQAQKRMDDAAARTIARTVVRVVLRTIAAQKAKERMETESAISNLLINVGTDLLTSQLEKADTRSCFLVPKRVHVLRIPVEPGTHSMKVAARDGNGGVVEVRRFTDIKVGTGQKRFLFFSSLR